MVKLNILTQIILILQLVAFLTRGGVTMDTDYQPCQVSKEMDELESLVNQTIALPEPSKIRQIEEKQLALRQEILQVINNGKNFLQDARK
ncbi:UNVERIFIED_CONTAM: hypothetical protein NCL1_44321, partial [Trichonephila clavipes]